MRIIMLRRVSLPAINFLDKTHKIQYARNVFGLSEMVVNWLMYDEITYMGNSLVVLLKSRHLKYML